MDCEISYSSPDQRQVSCSLGEVTEIGRSPSDGGIRLTPEDQSISGTAFVVERRDRQVLIRNTSSYAQLDVHHEQGVRFLFPGEELVTAASVVVVVPGSVYTHTINIQVTGGVREPGPATGTTPLLREFAVPPERKRALVGLCAARFFPDRLGAALLSASDIAALLTAAGEPVTAKAVNNKLQRLRTDVAQKLGLYLDRREDLADWAIRQGHVTRSDVERLLGN